MDPGEEIGIRIDEILVQDITGTAAMMHFEAMQLQRVRCKVACVYGDHNVLQVSEENTEDHVYLSTAARKYGMWWAKPGAGIGHQIHQEHFACPGETALGADSHTPHIGGMGTYAMGSNGAPSSWASHTPRALSGSRKMVRWWICTRLATWCVCRAAMNHSES